MKRSLKPPGRKAAALLTTMGVLMAMTLSAESEYYIVPSITVSELYDDNIFFDLSDEESAYITRVSPELTLGYESHKLTWSGSHRVDAEQYREHSELNSNAIRRFSEVAAEFLPSSRMTFSADANHTETQTPIDISLVPGGDVQGSIFGRVKAERTSFRPAVSYRFTQTLDGSIAYMDIRDKFTGGLESNTITAEADIEKKLSPVNAFSLGYIYREFRFDRGQGQVNTNTFNEYSHTPWLGLSHKINSRNSVVVQAGRTLSGGSTDPFLLMEWRGRYPKGHASLQYERNETILLGDANRQKFETVSARYSRKVSSRLNFMTALTYTKISPGGSSSETYRAALEGKYKISNSVFLSGTYDFNVQRVKFVGGAVEEVTRNVIQLGITFTYPRRTRDDDETETENDY